MNIESSDILYIGSSILGAAAVITFVTGQSTLSPVTKIGIMALLFGFLLVLGTYMEERLTQILSYGLAALTYLVGTGYTLSTFGLSSDTGFLAFLVSAAVFAGLGYLLTNKGLSVSEKQFKTASAIILVLGLSLALFDMTGAQTTYTTNLQDQVTITEGEQVHVGQLIVQNSFPLSRNVELPNYQACIYTPERREADVRIQNRYDFDMIGGNQVEELDLELYPLTRNHEDEQQELGTFTVEKADQCPDTSNENKIVITRQEN